MDTYNVTVEKSGYSTGYYLTNDLNGLTVESDSVSEELSIVANNVLVSGIVTSVMQDQAASLTTQRLRYILNQAEISHQSMLSERILTVNLSGQQM